MKIIWTGVNTAGNDRRISLYEKKELRLVSILQGETTILSILSLTWRTSGLEWDGMQWNEIVWKRGEGSFTPINHYFYFFYFLLFLFPAERETTRKHFFIKKKKEKEKKTVVSVFCYVVIIFLRFWFLLRKNEYKNESC
ncbi:hypothetical protein ACOSP7_014904 [Xanthoceras sorbifolium]